MPKTFTKKEKEIIRNIIIQKGWELFSTKGLKNTSITELTNAASIAQGSFYNFFDSKEELFFEILELEEYNSEQFLIDNLKSSNSSKEAIKKILKGSYQLFEANPLIRRLYESRDYDSYGP